MLVRRVLYGGSTAEGVANLEIAGAGAWPDEGIGAQIALDVGRDDLSRDLFAGNKPLICPRHCDVEVWRKEM